MDSSSQPRSESWHGPSGSSPRRHLVVRPAGTHRVRPWISSPGSRSSGRPLEPEPAPHHRVRATDEQLGVEGSTRKRSSRSTGVTSYQRLRGQRLPNHHSGSGATHRARRPDCSTPSGKRSREHRCGAGSVKATGLAGSLHSLRWREQDGTTPRARACRLRLRATAAARARYRGGR